MARVQAHGSRVVGRPQRTPRPCNRTVRELVRELNLSKDMWITALLPLITSMPHAAVEVQSPRAARFQLADTLAQADSIDGVTANGRTIAFAITRDGAAFRVAATTRKNGDVISLVVAKSDGRVSEQGGLTWLADELDDGVAVTRLVVDEDGAVTIATSAGRKYMAIPGRGSGGNAAVEAQWAAEWDRGVY